MGRKLSGHGDIRTKKLTSNQIRKIKMNGRTTITLFGEKRTITDCNLKGSTIEYYKRSDKPGYSIRNYCRDGSGARAAGRNRRLRGFEGDTWYVKEKNYWL